MQKNLKIGEFSLLAGMSVKTLRFYADEGLLLPATVASETGYRFYEMRQLADAVRILNLREAGVSLGDIRKLNERSGLADEHLTSLLRAQRTSLMKERARIESRMRIVDGLIASVDRRGASAVSEMRVTCIDPEFVYSIRRTVEENSASVTAMFENAEQSVAAVDARANRPPFLILHSTDNTSKTDVEVCIPVIDNAIDELPTKLVTGAEFVCSVTYSGGYHQTPLFRDRIKEFLCESGLRPLGPMREVFQRFGADQDGYSLPKRVLATSSDGYVTKLQLPIEAV